MTKARSKLTEQALEIVLELEGLKHPFIRWFPTEQPVKLGDRVRHVMQKSLRDSVTITIKSDRIYIGTKNKSREERLREMVRRLAMHVEDEGLYEEAMQLAGAF